MPDNPPSEIQSLIGKHVDAFNTQNVELFLTVFSDDAIIIDGIAPYRWLNPNAPANWLADVEKWRQDLSGVTPSICARNRVLERRERPRLRRHRRDALGDHQGPNRRPHRNARLHVFKARRDVEDRRPGVGPHVVGRMQTLGDRHSPPAGFDTGSDFRTRGPWRP